MRNYCGRRNRGGKRMSENEEYDEWVEVNKNNIMEAYIDGLDFGDIPEVFIQDLFEKERIK